MNRAIYQTSMHRTTRSASRRPSLTVKPAGWNGRLVYTFGGGCTGGWYRQGNSHRRRARRQHPQAGLRARLVVAQRVRQQLPGRAPRPRSMMMVKERFIETYGQPRYTIGWGCSGGSYQQHQIADNYPGLLDGILPRLQLPRGGVRDDLLDHRPAADGRTTSATSRRAPSPTRRSRRPPASSTSPRCTRSTVYDGALRIAPDVFCPSVLPADLRYDPATNPSGARCDVYDHAINIYGTDPATGFARRPLDNVGVEYGLEALNAGTITRRAVPRPQRGGRRLRPGRQLRGGAHRGRPRGDRAGLPDRAPDERRRRAEGHPDHRLPRPMPTTTPTATSTCATTPSPCASG